MHRTNLNKIKNQLNIFFSIFIVWQTVYKNEKLIQKNHAVMNIQDLNQAVILNTYSLSLQSDITAAIAECKYISIMNSKDFFYQWQVVKTDWEKLTIVSY